MDTLLLGCLFGPTDGQTEYRDGPVRAARRPSRHGMASFARSPVSHRLRGLRVIAGIPGPAPAQPGSAVRYPANGAKFVSPLLPLSIVPGAVGRKPVPLARKPVRSDSAAG